MSKNRSRYEQYISILLLLVDSDQPPTRLMYGSNLSWLPFTKYINNLCDKGLVERLPPRDKRSKVRYAITLEGRQILKRNANAAINRKVLKI